jgi:hypothetical protein
MWKRYTHRKAMATNRPRTTISFEPEEYEELKKWANSEYRTVPQLVLVFVKKALDERRATIAESESNEPVKKLNKTSKPRRSN